MRKQTKLVAVLSTAALLALGASMSSFAATGWAEENGTWVYYDKNGDLETEKWEKSGDNWYYLDENGEMAVDSLIEYDNDYYYVNGNGVMVANTWVSIENEDYDGEDGPASFWYYFGSDGAAYKNSKESVSFKTINDKKYGFDAEGKMLYGWINEKGEAVDWDTATYYLGDENDGSQKTGWQYLTVTVDDDDENDWFYFGANGKKVYSDDKKINGKTYLFQADGRMEYGWVAASGSTAWQYYGSSDDGARVTKGWFKTVAAEGLNKDNYDEDTEAWYYADNKGNIYTNRIESINGSKYLFNENGEMVSGLKFVAVNGDVVTAIEGVDTEEEFMNLAATTGYNAYYFGGSEDGAMKTGKQTISIDDEYYDFSFTKSGSTKGTGVDGLDSNKYYIDGMLLRAAKEDKYAVVKVENGQVTLLSTDSITENMLGGSVEYKLINTSGTVQKNKSKATDGNDVSFKTDKNGNITGIEE